MTGPRRPVAALVALGALLLVLFASAGVASAHPLGNFTINRYARVEVSAGAARVLYVLDLAEIPAFQVRDEVAADPDAYAREKIREIADGLTLEVDGQALPLEASDYRLSQPEGQGGLSTLRLTVLYEADLPQGAADEVLDATFTDDNGGGRIGWREVVVVAEGDASILDADVPAEDVTDELRSYPEDRIGSPLDVNEASFTFAPGSDTAPAPAIDGRGGERVADRFTGLLDRQGITPIVLVGMLGVAVLVGVGHALAPGHGKTVMAAYLIGTRGRPVDAVLLGVIVSAMHTASVLVLGVILYQADQRFALDRIYPILTLVSGVGVIIVGVWLATTRARTLRTAVRSVDSAAGPPHHDHAHADDHAHDDHDHAHDDHAHDDHAHDDHADVVAHASTSPGPGSAATATVAPADRGGDGHHEHDDHGHHHGPGGHSHELPEGVAPLSKRGLLLLATAGGVVPSPSAVIVLVSAFTLGRVGLGLALVAAFSVGLAATLTAVGLALVLGSRALGDRVSHRFVRIFPLLGAAALLVLGAVLTVQGVTGL